VFSFISPHMRSDETSAKSNAKNIFFPQFVLVPPLHSLSHPQPPSSQCDTNVAVTAAAAAALAMLLLRTPYERSSLADSVAAVR
jgi:hypothetical protein